MASEAYRIRKNTRPISTIRRKGLKIEPLISGWIITHWPPFIIYVILNNGYNRIFVYYYLFLLAIIGVLGVLLLCAPGSTGYNAALYKDFQLPTIPN